jgi:DNA-binding CsgD family transcriptional regulator
MPNDAVRPGSESLQVPVAKLFDSFAQLSPREVEIYRMVAKGHSNKMIADILNISAWTVCTHLRRVFAKLGVSSRAAMVARLMESEAASHRQRRYAVATEPEHDGPPAEEDRIAAV